MARLLATVVAVMAALLALFILAEALAIPGLINPEDYMGRGGVMALLGMALLVADVLLPVPSSVVMVAHGALFGFVLGAAASLLGAVGAAVAGYGIGRRGGPMMARLLDPRLVARSGGMVRSWGELAIIATRPVPILAETTAILAGAGGLGWTRLLRGAALGSVPPALLYAWAGASAADVGGGLVVFALVSAVAVATWLVGRMVGMSDAAAPVER